MKWKNDRSKTIIRKTTKNYHPRADKPRLLNLQKKEDESNYLCIIVH